VDLARPRRLPDRQAPRWRHRAVPRRRRLHTSPLEFLRAPPYRRAWCR
jgi:hypothetical protein